MPELLERSRASSVSGYHFISANTTTTALRHDFRPRAAVPDAVVLAEATYRAASRDYETALSSYVKEPTDESRDRVSAASLALVDAMRARQRARGTDSVSFFGTDSFNPMMIERLTRTRF